MRSPFRLGEVGQRRLARFRANRRGVWSLRIFAVLFGLALCAEGFANDRPLLLVYQGEYYVPILRTYPETTFGGFLETEADYRDAEVRELILADGWMLWPPIPFHHSTVDYDLGRPAPASPDARHWLGTDDQARDVTARLIYGFRLSILFAFLLTGLSSAIGVLVGAVQGYFGGLLDLTGQRLIEIWGSLPTLYLLIIVSSLIQPSFWVLLGLLLFFSWTQLVGVVRAEFLRVRNFDYVRAARALGAPDWKIMVRHVLPNATVATLSYMPFLLAGAITSLTSLDFLGLGLPPGSASLGELLNQGKNNLQAPWLGLSSFLVLSAMLGLLVFIGEAVRDALDPRKLFSAATPAEPATSTLAAAAPESTSVDEQAKEEAASAAPAEARQRGTAAARERGTAAARERGTA